MSFVLDCEDGESTIQSLCEGFDCEQRELVDVLESIDIEGVYSDLDSSPDIESQEYLYNQVVEKLGEPDETESVCWFHLTRTLEGNDFSDGILPLSEALDIIWKTLLSIFNETDIHDNLKSMMENGVDDFQFNLKSDNETHSGPYGILVREIACNSEELSQHDYLELPEIIEDICNGYFEEFGVQIYDEVASALVPCVVKFTEETIADQGAIEAALYYAYTYSNDLPVSANSIYCYDGENCAVSFEDIISVEFLEENDC